MPRIAPSLITGVLILYGSCSSVNAADSRLTGYLVDRSCADASKSQGTSIGYLQSHKKECALNESCSKAGFALYSKGKWYNLNGRGNELARNLLKASPTPEGHFVTVFGKVENEQLTVSQIKELAAANNN